MVLCSKDFNVSVKSETPREVELADEKSVNIIDIFRINVIEEGDVKLPIDFIPFMREFQLMVGMDWLCRY